MTALFKKVDKTVAVLSTLFWGVMRCFFSSFDYGKTALASVGCLSDTTSLKIISGDLCGRNGLKSKVSTLEELYDFFSENTQKLHRMM